MICVPQLHALLLKNPIDMTSFEIDYVLGKPIPSPILITVCYGSNLIRDSVDDPDK